MIKRIMHSVSERNGESGRKDGIMVYLFLIKPKTADSRGEVQISTGYGVEGPIPI